MKPPRPDDCPGPQPTCPWEDEDHMEKVTSDIAREASRRWWTGFPWTPILMLLAMSGTLVGVLWTNLTVRVSQVEAAAATQAIGAARRETQLQQLQEAVISLMEALKERDSMVAENNRLLRILVGKRGGDTTGFTLTDPPLNGASK